jgi:quercetin dioxygenase-like cupin family protein
MSDDSDSKPAVRLRPTAAIPLTGPVPFMHADDVGKLYVPGSQRAGMRLRPNYAQQEDGVDTVKVLLLSDHTLMFEAFRPKGASDRAHMHPDHESLCYQKQGRVRMRIGDDWFTVEAGDAYMHPIGVIHQHEALEDSVRIEIKTFPRGGAVAAWKALVGESLPVDS